MAQRTPGSSCHAWPVRLGDKLLPARRRQTSSVNRISNVWAATTRGIANFDIQLSTPNTAAMATFSSDLLWEITKYQGSSTLVKRPQSGGIQFSRDPLNLKNQYSRKVRRPH